MLEAQIPERKAPHCPMCSSQMNLKTVHRQEPAYHFIYKCSVCAIEYPVAVTAHGG